MIRQTGMGRAAARAAGSGCIVAVVVGVVVAALATGSARGEVLVRYEFPGGTSKAPTVTGANVTASAFQYDGDGILSGLWGPVGNPPGSHFSITTFTTIGDAKTLGLAPFSTLAPAPGRALNLQSFRVDLAAYSIETNAYTGQLVVYSSLDNYLDPIYVNFAQDTGQNDGAVGPWQVFENTSLALNPLYQNVTGPIAFRYYTSGTTKSFVYLDNVQITGTTTAVPEPAGCLAALAAAAGLTTRRRRRLAPPADAV